MTKIKQRYEVFRRYKEDLWGFFHISQNKSLTYWKMEDYRRSFRRPILSPFLDLKAVVPKKRKKRSLSFYGRLHNFVFQLRRYFANLNNRQLYLLSQKALNTETSLVKNFSFSLESRVDAVLLRINLFTSIGTIRQWILHGFILVNLKGVWTSNQNLKIGDVLSFSNKHKTLLKNYFFQRYFNFSSTLEIYLLNREFFSNYSNSSKIPFFLPRYLDLNYRLFFFCFWRAPKWSEIPFLRKFKSYRILSFPYIFK